VKHSAAWNDLENSIGKVDETKILGSTGKAPGKRFVPDVAGTYVVEVGLVPAQLTAYDAAWLEVK
jgi:hypothetical protein